MEQLIKRPATFGFMTVLYGMMLELLLAHKVLLVQMVLLD
jgi:hypothetical protein